MAEEAEKIGRDPAAIEVSRYLAPSAPPELRRLADAGVHRAVFGLPPADGDDLLPLLDHYAAAAAEVG